MPSLQMWPRAAQYNIAAPGLETHAFEVYQTDGSIRSEFNTNKTTELIYRFKRVETDEKFMRVKRETAVKCVKKIRLSSGLTTLHTAQIATSASAQ